MTTVTVIGLGEAGRIYAEGLAAAGAVVRGFDPFVHDDPVGVQRFDSLQQALAGADAVISLVGAAAAVAVAADALPLVHGGVYADFNTATPEVKSAIAARAVQASVRMADVAVLAPVPRSGVATELIASGTGAEAFAAVLRPLGAPVTTIDAEAGAAARLKLLRSVFMKGLATLIIEGLTAAELLGSDDWLRAQISDELGTNGARLVERLVDGTYRHAERREHEMQDALSGLEATGAPTDMTRATLVWFQRIVESQRVESTLDADAD